MTYTGAELQSLFAYKNFKLQGDSVIAFCGPCDVQTAALVDQEDVLNKDFIRSAYMVNFIVEKFNLDLEEGIFRQRLYMVIIKETLEFLKPELKIIRTGDDLFINHKKLSVSIATLSPVSTLIHIGINIDPVGAPVKAIGLQELKINTAVFIKRVLAAIAEEEQSINLARCKVRGVQ
jgi:hypothetical protein